MPPLIELCDVTHSYTQGGTRTVALDGVNLEVERGEAVALVGPSGSGKSTVLSSIGVMLRPSQGDVRLDGVPVPERESERAALRNRFFGYVHQELAIIEDLGIEPNVAVPLNYSSPRPRKKERKERVARALLAVGLPGAHGDVKRLSGGERQRVAVARALVNTPTAILADEPTAALDRETGDQVVSLLLERAADGGAVIIATHDPRVADRCSRVVMLRDGRMLPAAT